MRKVYFAAAFFLCAQVLSAQVVLEGVIRSSSGGTLPGATIFIPELKTGTTSDVDGNFQLTGLPKTRLLVQFSYVGYATTSRQVTLNESVLLDITLEREHMEAGEVVVTALSPSAELRTVPVSLQSLKADELRREGGTNLIHSLSTVPGVAGVSTGPAISKPVIHGLSGNRVLTIYNGLQQEGQQWGGEHGIEIDPYAVTKVEIMKGPGSLLYGSDALAGVLNIESGLNLQEGKLTGEVVTEGHSDNNLLGGSVAAGLRENGWQGQFRVSAREAGDYQNAYDGEVYNSGFSERTLSGQLGINREWGYSRIFGDYFFQQPQLTEGEREADGSFAMEEAPFQQIRHSRIGTVNRFYPGQSKVSIEGGYQVNRRQEFEEPEEAELDMQLQTTEGLVRWYLPEVSNWEIAFSGNGSYQTNTNLGEEALIPDYNAWEAGVSAFFQKRINKLYLSSGLRVDLRNLHALPRLSDGDLQFEDFTREFHGLSGGLGLAWLASEQWTLKANVARGFRSPNLAELASNGVHEGTFRYELGNTSLQAETNIQGDLAVDYNSDHLSASVSLFYNQLSNYIFIQKLSSVAGGDSLSEEDGDFFSTFQYGQSVARLYGGEVALDWHPHPLDWLHIGSSFEVVYGEQRDNGQYLPLIPAPHYHGELRGEWNGRKKRLDDLFIKVAVDHHFRQERVLAGNDFETPANAYTLLSAGAGLTLRNKNGSPLVEVVVLGENLLNSPYQNHLSRLRYTPENPATGRVGVFDMGRNIQLKLRVPLYIALHKGGKKS